MPIERMRATRSFLQQFIEAVPGAVYAKDRAGRVLLGNGAFGEAVGWEAGDFIGKDDLQLLVDKDLARTVMENDQRIMDGNSRCQVEEELRAEDGSTTCWLSTKAPFTDDDDRVVGLVGVSIDITERKRLEERERLLAQEIEHRNKNLLGVVQSVVSLTKASTTEDFRKAVMGRLEALSRAQGLLMRNHRDGASLRDLLADELAAYNVGAGRVHLDGPPVSVSADAGQALAMAFHELATNATKYGAFADRSGHLEVVWKLAQGHGEKVEIEWRETGGPPADLPEHQGFGTKVLRAVLEQQLRGQLSCAWEPTGLCCSISLPMRNIRPK